VVAVLKHVAMHRGRGLFMVAVEGLNNKNTDLVLEYLCNKPRTEQPSILTALKIFCIRLEYSFKRNNMASDTKY
jgi:hypothetical protein